MGIANVLNEEKKQYVLALGQLGWSLPQIQLASLHPSARSPSRLATLYTESSDSFLASATASNRYRVERASSPGAGDRLKIGPA